MFIHLLLTPHSLALTFTHSHALNPLSRQLSSHTHTHTLKIALILNSSYTKTGECVLSIGEVRRRITNTHLTVIESTSIWNFKGHKLLMVPVRLGTVQSNRLSFVRKFRYLSPDRCSVLVRFLLFFLYGTKLLIAISWGSSIYIVLWDHTNNTVFFFRYGTLHNSMYLVMEERWPWEGMIIFYS